MANGADKYGPFNWREYPVQMMTYLEAMQRHIAALIDGEDLAEDTGIHHLKHVVAGGGILLDSIALGIVIDNRPPKGPAADMLRQLDKSVTPAGTRRVAPSVPIEDDYGLPGLVEIEEGEQFICGHWWGQDPVPYGQDNNCGDLCHFDKTHGIAM